MPVSPVGLISTVRILYPCVQSYVMSCGTLLLEGDSWDARVQGSRPHTQGFDVSHLGVEGDDDDAPRPISSAPRSHAMRLALIEGAGHLPCTEWPGGFAASVAALFDQVTDDD